MRLLAVYVFPQSDERYNLYCPPNIMSIFQVREQEKHLNRLYRQSDELARMNDELAQQRDFLAREIEATRIAVSLMKMDREVIKPEPLKMEIV
jgi:hypothetical protein